MLRTNNLIIKYSIRFPSENIQSKSLGRNFVGGDIRYGEKIIIN